MYMYVFHRVDDFAGFSLQTLVERSVSKEEEQFEENGKC